MIAVPKEQLVRIHASSGTTGKQTVVGYTKNDIDVWAKGAARALVAAGATKSDYIHVSYGYGLFTGGLGLHYGAEMLGATAIPGFPPEIPSARWISFGITAPISCAAPHPMPCTSAKRCGIWALSQNPEASRRHFRRRGLEREYAPGNRKNPGY